MTKTVTPSLLKVDTALLSGMPCANTTVVRNVKIIPAHPILLVSNMSSPSAGELPFRVTISFAHLLEQYCAERLMSRANNLSSLLFYLLLEVCSVDQPDHHLAVRGASLDS